MNKYAERIETISHLIIDKVAEVAASILKAVVTLVCLGASIAYRAGVKAREIFDAQNADVPVEIEITEETQDTETIETIDDDNNDALDVVVITANQIVNTVNNINIVRPVIKTNSLDAFIATGLVNELSNNFLESVCYTLPRNKRTKKGYVRHGDIGVLTEYNELLISKGILN